MPKPDELIDREISWLSFNERVLELAEDKEVPLLERLRYLAIFSNNLDEFFMVRVASILGKIENQITSTNTAGYTPQQLLTAVTDKARILASRQANLFKTINNVSAHESLLFDFFLGPTRLRWRYGKTVSINSRLRTS